MVTSCSFQGTGTLYNKKRGVLPVHHLYAFLHNFWDLLVTNGYCLLPGNSLKEYWVWNFSLLYTLTGKHNRLFQIYNGLTDGCCRCTSFLGWGSTFKGQSGDVYERHAGNKQVVHVNSKKICACKQVVFLSCTCIFSSYRRVQVSTWTYYTHH